MNRYTIRGFKYGDNESPMSKLQEFENKVEDGEVIEIRHGEYHNTRFTDGVFYQEQCSVCGEWTYEYDKNFCPYCGAKMNEKGNNDEQR